MHNLKEDLELLENDHLEFVLKRCTKAFCEDAKYRELSIRLENTIILLNEQLPENQKGLAEKCNDIVMELLDKNTMIAYDQSVKDMSLVNLKYDYMHVKIY